MSEFEQLYSGRLWSLLSWQQLTDFWARMVKIYDPNNLGVSCGFSKNPPPPGWVMSRVPPVEVQRAGPLPESRKRW